MLDPRVSLTTINNEKDFFLNIQYIQNLHDNHVTKQFAHNQGTYGFSYQGMKELKDLMKYV